MMSNLLSILAEIVGENGVLTGKALSGRSAGVWAGGALQALALVRPSTTVEVAAVLKACNAAGQSVVPVGGMTGLAGAHETGPDDIALSLERMTAIEPIDTQSRTVTVEGGAILQTVQERAADAGLMFPLDLGARASCTIGGNIATNAGGVRVIRYGMMRDLVLGVEAVLADGTVISSMSGLIKNNTGYDLRQMFVGSEGTLGVITRAILRLHEAPLGVETALLAVPSWDAIMGLLRYFDRELAGGLVAFEVLWRDYYDLNTGPYSDVGSPLTESAPFYVLMEVFVSDADKGRDELEALLMQCIERGDVVDGVIAKSQGERLKIWQIRESFEPEKKRFGPTYGHDVSLRIEDMEDYVEAVRRNLTDRWPAAELFTLGHIGDGNIHFSVANVGPEDLPEAGKIIYGPLAALNGSVSAEHGIGLEKKDYLGITRSHEEIELMRRTKKMMDPNGILNPGKIFDI